MDESDQPPKKIRKGAKSCTECRRRKIRCVWLTEDAQTCRRCEERGVTCLAQTVSTSTLRGDGLSSRERISRLEQQVASLTKVVNGIQEKSGGPPVLENVAADHSIGSASSDDEEWDEAGPASDSLPAYIRNLFDNSFITYGGPSGDAVQRQKNMMCAFVEKARGKLQRLIPPQSDVEAMAEFASLWIGLYQTMFPTSSIVQDEVDLTAKYTTMRDPHVDIYELATWLISIAITVQQVPEDRLKSFQGINNAPHYARAVSEVVDSSIISQDSMLSTIGGMSTALHFLRLQAGRTNVKKTWILLRRVISIAELMGLPRMARAYHRRTLDPDRSSQRDGVDKGDDDGRIKFETWNSMCVLDRLLGVMCNLPIGSAKYTTSKPATNPDSDIRDILRGYLRDLADIATKIQELDDFRAAGASDDEIYAGVLRIDQDLISLASTAPPAWWDANIQLSLSRNLLPYWHYYITLRAHLFLTLQRDDKHRYDYSRFTCMNACQEALKRFLQIRPHISSGFFMARLMDLQGFTASVVLLLCYHGTRSEPTHQFQSHSIAPPKELIAQVTATIKGSAGRKSTDFGAQAISTIKALSALFDHGGRMQPQDLTLRVPMLGNIRVQRNANGHLQQTEKHHIDNRHHIMSSSLIDSRDPSSVDTFGSAVTSDQQVPDFGSWRTDPFTWSIEQDPASVFKDELFAEDLGFFESPLDQEYFQFGTG